MSGLTKYYTSFIIAEIDFTVVSSASGIKKIIFNMNKRSEKLKTSVFVEPNDTNMYNIHLQLTDYFKGERKVFNLPLEITGTEFQKKVWNELLKIPYGETISYKELAIRLEDEKVIRAAAHANGVNPLPIVIPCHRVIGSNGSLVGYGGGLHIKAKLLQLEGSREPDFFN